MSDDQITVTKSWDTNLSEIENLAEMTNDYDAFLQGIYANPPSKISNQKLYKIRDALWSYGRDRDIHIHLAVINSELQRRFTNVQLVISASGFIIAALSFSWTWFK